jgi:hypothetical protein
MDWFPFKIKLKLKLHFLSLFIYIYILLYHIITTAESKFHSSLNVICNYCVTRVLAPREAGLKLATFLVIDLGALGAEPTTFWLLFETHTFKVKPFHLALRSFNKNKIQKMIQV